MTALNAKASNTIPVFTVLSFVANLQCAKQFFACEFQYLGARRLKLTSPGGELRASMSEQQNPFDILIEQIREELATIAGNEFPLLTPEQLAKKLSVPISWVYEQSRQGNIPTRRIGKYIRFNFVEVVVSQKQNGRSHCETQFTETPFRSVVSGLAATEGKR
jgi:hypothetical protein